MAGLARSKVPLFWQNVMAVVALGKAAIAGVGLGIAALGIVDVATAHHIREAVSAITHNHALDVFAAGGGAIGFTARLIMSVLSR